MTPMQRKTQGSRAKSRADRSPDGAVSTPRGPVKVDELDLALIARLREEGRASNRSLAEALGVNDATIATRLRRLEDESIVRVVAVTDMAAFGHDLLAFALVRCDGRPVPEVGEELTALQEAIGVVVTTGRVDLVLSVLARDRAHLADLVAAIGAVRGVASVGWELALDVRRYESEWAVLAADDHPVEPWAASDVVDELDLRIIGLLQQDARSSNRRIAAELGVSEGTVRTRVRRLAAERLNPIPAISHVAASGLGASAYVGVTTEGGRVAEVADAIIEHVPANCVIRSLGEFDLFLVLSASTRAELVQRVLGEIGTLPGVRRTETIENSGTLKHSYTWARIL
jgi:DNA-binding Lrp family transcriptional regulator